MRLIVISLLVAVFSFTACNKKTKKVATKPVVKEAVAQPDTTVAQDSVEIDELLSEEPAFTEEEIQEPAEPQSTANDRFFLISASFSDYANAEKHQQSLIRQGFTSEIITRQEGANSNFYKVSYMSFSNYREALQKLDQERNTPGKEHVWLLVKK